MNSLFLYSLIYDKELEINSYFTEFISNLDEQTKEKYETIISKAEFYVTPNNDVSDNDNVFSIFPEFNRKGSCINYPYGFSTLTTTSGYISSESNKSDWEHLQEFKNGVSALISLNPSEGKLANSLFTLMRQYLWCISSGKMPYTLSKYEYVKSLAAFAQCLYYVDPNEKHPFLLLCADISGIQSFIYDIHSNRAAMSMKGRSFYLHLLLDSLISKILDISDLPICNLIYSSGGKAYLLLPNTEEVRANLKNLETSILQRLFSDYHNSLYIVMDYITFNLYNGGVIESKETNFNGDHIESLSELWQAVSTKAAYKKQLRFKELFSTPLFYSQLFKGKGLEEDYNGLEMEVCAVTGRPTHRSNKLTLTSEDEEIFVLPLVKQQYELGKDLRLANTIARTNRLRSSETEGEWVNPLSLGINHILLKDISEQDSTHTLINPDQSLKEYYEREKLFSQIIFYGGNRQAEIDGRLKDYSELVEPDSGKNFRKLGILRMDIDNLGKLFTDSMTNLGKEYLTFASYSNLSSQLDWFFSGYLNVLRNRDCYEKFVNVLYSGGDDLFAVGRWDKIISFAEDVRRDFAQFVCGNHITLSAGIALTGAKFPISKGADLAGEALEEAKDFYFSQQSKQRGKPDKNAIHLLGTTVSWNKEFPFVRELALKFEGMLQNGLITKGFIYRLFYFQSLKQQNRLDWWWKSAYIFARLETRAKKQKKYEYAEIIETLKNALATHKFNGGNSISFEGIEFQASLGRMLDLVCLAGKLADYTTR